MEVSCSSLKSVGGVKDFYLTASGISGEVLVGNIVFAGTLGEIECTEEPCGEPGSSSSEASSSSSLDSLSSASSSSVDSLPSSIVDVRNFGAGAFGVFAHPAPKFIVDRVGGSYMVRFEAPGDYALFVFNPMGQLMARRNVIGGAAVELSNLPKGNYIFKAVRQGH